MLIEDTFTEKQQRARLEAVFSGESGSLKDWLGALRLDEYHDKFVDNGFKDLGEVGCERLPRDSSQWLARRFGRAMDRHQDAAKVQETACGALWNLARNDANQVILAVAVPKIIRAMDRLLRDKRARQLAERRLVHDKRARHLSDL